jgi:hypothetical protein
MHFRRFLKRGRARANQRRPPGRGEGGYCGRGKHLGRRRDGPVSVSYKRQMKLFADVARVTGFGHELGV